MQPSEEQQKTVPDPEEFREISNQSIWALAKYIAAIADVLKKELPFDTLTASCHVEDGTDDFTIGILARRGDCYHSIMIYTHYLDAPPEPKEVYPDGCCAIGALHIFSPLSVAARDFGSVRNSGALDGPSKRQMGAAFRFVRGFSDGDELQAHGR